MIKLTQFYANRTTFHNKHGEAIYVNPRYIVSMFAYTIGVILAPGDQSIPVKDRTQETATSLTFNYCDHEGTTGGIEVTETPEQILKLAGPYL